MALSGSATTQVGTNYFLDIEWSASQNIANNTTTITASLYWRSDGYGYVNSSTTKNAYIIIDGHAQWFTNTAGLAKGEKKLLGTKSHTITHNNDGTRWVDVGGYFDPDVTINGAFRSDIYVNCPSTQLNTIPRASTITSNVSWTAGVDNLSISISRASTDFRHKLEIHVEHTSGQWWELIGSRDGIGDSTTWVFSEAENKKLYETISMYENRPVILRVRTYNSAGTQIGDYWDKGGTVYAIATATATLDGDNHCDIANSMSIYINNFHGNFRYDVTLRFGGFAKTFPNVSTQNYTMVFTDDEINQLYSKIPNANSGVGEIEVRTKYSDVFTEDGIPYTNKTAIYLYVQNANPTFGTGYTYRDTNATVKGVTGNDQYIVQSKSNLLVEIPVGARALPQKSASMVRYEATVNGVTKTANWSSTTTVSFDFGVVNASSNATLDIKAIDSRGNYVTTSKTINIVPYSNPIAVLSADRLNGFEESTDINVSGSIQLLNVNGTNKNSLITTIAEPTVAPTLTKPTASSTLTAGTYYVAYTWYNSLGETTRGTYVIPSITTASGQQLVITLPTKPTGATGAKIYVGTSSVTLRYQGTTTGTTYTISTPINTSNAVFPTVNTTGQLQFRYKKATDSTYSQWDSLMFTVNGANYTATKRTLTLDNLASWDVQVQITDKLSTNTALRTVPVGQPMMFMDSVKKSIGFGKFPDKNDAFDFKGNLLLGGYFVQPLQSKRDFTYGTQIKTDIRYDVKDGDPFLLEIEGNSYGSKQPFDIKIQGYIYNNTIINFGGISNGATINGLVAMNHGGYLTFWFPVQAYWQGFTVYCNASYEGEKRNRVTGIYDTVKPVGTKEILYRDIDVQKPLHINSNGSAIYPSENTDFNTLVTTGFYRISSTVNAPPKSSVNPDKWWYVQVIMQDNDWIVQTAYDFRDGVYIRRKWGGTTWDKWRRIGDERRAILRVADSTQGFGADAWYRVYFQSVWNAEGISWDGSINAFTVPEDGWYHIGTSFKMNITEDREVLMQIWQFNTSDRHVLIEAHVEHHGNTHFENSVPVYLKSNSPYEFVFLHRDTGYPRSLYSLKAWVFKI